MNTRALFAKIASLSLLGLGLMSPVVYAQGSGKNQPSFVAGRLLVKFKEGVSDGQARGLLAARNALSTNVIPQIGVHIVQLPPNANEHAEANAFKGLGEVEFAEVDQIVAPQAITPNDTFFPSEMYPGWIKATDAWAVTTGLSSVTIALIDTGVYPIHADLSAKLVPGWNFFDGNSNTSDATGHGTWAAGVIAPSANNGFGVAGVCWGCKLMPVRVSDLSGNATVSNIANGITWAADHGAKIANLGYAVTSSSTINTAALYLFINGGITVAPSGNSGTFDSSADNPYILTVGGTDAWSDTIWNLSNTGNNVDLTAPNFSGYTTLNGGGYGPDNSGTCISAAIVSGVAALVWSVNPNLAPADVTLILEQSADDKGATGWDAIYGWGRVNALRAVNMATGARTSTITTLASSVNPSTAGQSVTFTATVSPSAATGTVTFFDGATSLGSGALSGGVATLSTSNLTSGTHSITATYGGNANYNVSTSTAVSETVNTGAKTNTATSLGSNPNPSTSGQLVTFTATVSPSAASGTVTFFDGASSLGSGALSGGVATLSTSSLTVGAHSITASYGGDNSYNVSTSPAVSETVNTATKTNTNLNLASNLNPSTPGQIVTITATISPSAATGAVTFFDGGVSIGSGTLSGGIASLSTSSLSVGSHSIQANYGGDSNYNGTISPILTQTVNTSTKTNTTMGLASSLNPSTPGQSVTFTATVSPATASGTVTFFDGAITLGSGALSGGIATFSTSGLAAGSHSITATYGGNASYNSSTSSALLQSVSAATQIGDFSITATPSSNSRQRRLPAWMLASTR